MTTPSWMPPQPELPWCEGSLDGDLPPSAVRQWAEDYALAAVDAYKKSLKPVAWVDRLDRGQPICVTSLSYCSAHEIDEGRHLNYLPLYRLDGEGKDG